jgi:Flp pilus assembly protein TadD
MTTRALLLGGISALLLGGTMVGCAANGGGIASASDRNAALATKGAAGEAGQAQAALARNDGPIAIGYAERAVALMPQQADYRMLLGQSYLKGGRFASASHAFADALQLSPTNGRAALNLALSQIATGDWQSARHSLEENAAIIPAVDRGLALSLAGDTAGGIAVLTEAARSSASNAKVRQNLALSFALAGRWQEARVVAAADMAPADVDARLEQWALFAQPAKASDQVASLLGVRAVADVGQPVALALNAPAPGVPEQALAAADPVVAPTEAAPVQIASVSAVGVSKIAFGPRQEVRAGGTLAGGTRGRGRLRERGGREGRLDPRRTPIRGARQLFAERHDVQGEGRGCLPPLGRWVQPVSGEYNVPPVPRQGRRLLRPPGGGRRDGAVVAQARHADGVAITGV